MPSDPSTRPSLRAFDAHDRSRSGSPPLSAHILRATPSSSMRSYRHRRLRTSEEGHVSLPAASQSSRRSTSTLSSTTPPRSSKLSSSSAFFSSPLAFSPFFFSPFFDFSAFLLKYPSFWLKSLAAGFALFFRRLPLSACSLRASSRAATTADRLANVAFAASALLARSFFKLGHRNAAARAATPRRRRPRRVLSLARGSTGRAAPRRPPPASAASGRPAREAAAQGAPGFRRDRPPRPRDRRPRRGGAGGRARLRPLPRDRRPRRGGAGRDARRGALRAFDSIPSDLISVLALTAQRLLRRCSLRAGVTAHQQSAPKQCGLAAHEAPCRRARDFYLHQNRFSRC